MVKFSEFSKEGYANGQASGLLNRDGLKSRLWVRIPPLPPVQKWLPKWWLFLLLLVGGIRRVFQKHKLLYIFEIPGLWRKSKSCDKLALSRFAMEEEESHPFR